MVNERSIILCSNKQVLRYLTKFLGNQSLFFAPQGEKALEMIIEAPPVLLILDNDLLDMKSLSLLKIIKISYPYVLILFMYDYQNPNLAIDAFRFGARDCVSKPVDFMALRRKVDLLLNAPKNDLFTEGNVFLNRNIHLNSHEKKLLQRIFHRKKRGVYQVTSFLNKNFSQKITLEQVAEIACMSKYHFSRMFKKQVGICWSDYLCRLRIENAKKLLVNSDLTVTDICEAVGYNDLTHFARTFKKNAGVPPRIYRKNVISDI